MCIVLYLSTTRRSRKKALYAKIQKLLVTELLTNIAWHGEDKMIKEIAKFRLRKRFTCNQSRKYLNARIQQLFIRNIFYTPKFDSYIVGCDPAYGEDSTTIWDRFSVMNENIPVRFSTEGSVIVIPPQA